MVVTELPEVTSLWLYCNIFSLRILSRMIDKIYGKQFINRRKTLKILSPCEENYSSAEKRR